MAAFDRCVHTMLVKNTENSDRCMRCAYIDTHENTCMCLYTLMKEYLEILKNTKADVNEVTNKT